MGVNVRRRGEGPLGNCLEPGPGAGARSLLAGRPTGAGFVDNAWKILSV